MKSKKSLYILIPLVVAVWGLIIYRVLDMTGAESDFSLPYAQHNMTIDSTLIKPYKKIKLKYADPFLKNSPSTGSGASDNSFNVFHTNPEPTKKEVLWPEIVYKGTIKNSSKQIAILAVSDNKKVVKKGQTIEGMEIKRIYKDSIILYKENEYKTIIK